jgi:putative FmdB family regulatory protein
MPIYAYRCSNCGHAQDVLQKISDPMLSVCPACGQATYVKQVTAAGFQLKGSGWYVTDFRNDGKAGKAADAAAGKGEAKDGTGAAEAPAAGAAAAVPKSGESTPAAAPAASAAAPAAAPAASPAPPSGKTGG